MAGEMASANQLAWRKKYRQRNGGINAWREISMAKIMALIAISKMAIISVKWRRDERKRHQRKKWRNAKAKLVAK
jgi:hypothetical protein